MSLLQKETACTETVCSVGTELLQEWQTKKNKRKNSFFFYKIKRKNERKRKIKEKMQLISLHYFKIVKSS